MTDSTATEPRHGYRIDIDGQVQGVGFRPHVWRTARALDLRGDVCNTASGVLIRLCCTPTELSRFRDRLLATAPPLARVNRVQVTPLSGAAADAGWATQAFAIRPSQAGPLCADLLPDAATCPACLAELFDPANRRYQHPFISCTHCGPRFSILQRMPYDRSRTSMARFPLCPACAQEYRDPADRRFHAQTNACPQCGPRLWLERPDGECIASPQPFAYLARCLARGMIVALKGIGGFHLCCDASQPAAVARLRARKQRPHKPMAVMFGSREQLAKQVFCTDDEAALLASAAAPIVLLRKRPGGSGLADAIAPDSAWLGCMLPHAPVQHLLLAACDRPLVMTSANRSGQPQVIDNGQARAHLADLADLLLLHDRDIVQRLDDAVVRLPPTGGEAEVLRPGRGLAPLQLPLPPGFRGAGTLLALGGDLKNTCCLASRGRLILSQHLGDLHWLAQTQAAEQARQHLLHVQGEQPKVLVHDRHPDYYTTRMAQALGAEQCLAVQHHHAHLAACLGEHAYPRTGAPLLAICLDGTGFGDPDGLWGGELLYGGYQQARRLASLRPCALPGGEQAVREPWRLLVAQLLQAGVEPTAAAFAPVLGERPLAALRRMLAAGLNSPLSSSCGRLFDAMAAALGCQADGVSHEGQAAAALEALALSGPEPATVAPYALVIRHRPRGLELDPAPLWPCVQADLTAGRAPAAMALAFHRGLAEGLVTLALRVRREHPFDQVVLTGGVLQNVLLGELLQQGLEQAGIRVLRHRRVPCNDAGLSLGQALVALARLQETDQNA